MILPPFWVDVPPHGGGWVTLQYVEEAGEKICNLYQLDGRLNLRPRAWLRAMRSELSKLEGIARDAGCTEFRMSGRDWSRVLPDYERIEVPGRQNVLRKKL